jgi:hypothetical protein
MCASFAAAQDITGSIAGTVRDPRGVSVPEAKITIISLDRNLLVRSTLTDGPATTRRRNCLSGNTL